MRRFLRLTALAALLTSTVTLAGCDSNVGVGLSVGVPVGSHGYVSVGSNRWF